MNGDRLSSVLRIRRVQERLARGELAARRHGHRVAEAAERLTWRLLDDRTATLQPACSASVMLGDRAIVAAGMLAGETQRAATATAADDVHVAVGQWTVAARRVEGLERLAERTELVEREASARRAANEIDDLALVRFAGQVA